MNFFGRAPAPAKPRVTEKDHMEAIGKLEASLKKAEAKQDHLESIYIAKRRQAAVIAAQGPGKKAKALLMLKESKMHEKRLRAAQQHYTRLFELKNAIDVVADQRENISDLQTHLATFNQIKGEEDLQEQADDVLDAHAEAVGDATDLLDSAISSADPLEDDPELNAELAAAMAEFGTAPAAAAPAAAATVPPAAAATTAPMAGLPPMAGIPAAPTHAVSPVAAAPAPATAVAASAATGDLAALSDFLA